MNQTIYFATIIFAQPCERDGANTRNFSVEKYPCWAKIIVAKYSIAHHSSFCFCLCFTFSQCEYNGNFKTKTPIALASCRIFKVLAPSVGSGTNIAPIFLQCSNHCNSDHCDNKKSPA